MIYLSPCKSPCLVDVQILGHEEGGYRPGAGSVSRISDARNGPSESQLIDPLPFVYISLLLARRVSMQSFDTCSIVMFGIAVCTEPRYCAIFSH